MISRAMRSRLAKLRAPACPPLAGGQFRIFVSHEGGMEEDGTVTIQQDLSYTLSSGESGQLTVLRPGKEYRYTEAGPPPVTGILKCSGGTWFFLDEDPGTAMGRLEPVY